MALGNSFFLMHSYNEIKSQTMITKSKLTKNSRDPKKLKRIFHTEPMSCQQNQEQQTAIKAKNYLMNLNTNEDGYQFLLKQKSEIDISLSQWNHLSFQNRLSERLVDSVEIGALQQRKRVKQQLCSFELELVGRQNKKYPVSMRNTNLSQFSKRIASKKFTLSPEQRNKLIQQSSILQGFEVCLPKKQKLDSFCLKNRKILKSGGPPKINISYREKLKNSSESPKNKGRTAQNKSRLPRLDHLQSQQYKNKYKSVFKQQVRKQTLSLPVHSPISKDINQIYSLIRQESIKFVKKPF